MAFPAFLLPIASANDESVISRLRNARVASAVSLVMGVFHLVLAGRDSLALSRIEAVAINTLSCVFSIDGGVTALLKSFQTFLTRCLSRCAGFSAETDETCL